MLSLLLSALDSTVVSTAMKTIVEKLVENAVLCVAVHYIYAVLHYAISVSGGLADIYGHKSTLLIESSLHRFNTMRHIWEHDTINYFQRISRHRRRNDCFRRHS